MDAELVQDKAKRDADLARWRLYQIRMQVYAENWDRRVDFMDKDD